MAEKPVPSHEFARIHCRWQGCMAIWQGYLAKDTESMKAEPVTAGGAEVSEKERDRKRKEQTRAETEARVKKRSHKVPLGEEKRAFPSRGDRSLRQCDDSLRC
jgi:hypothetical protein